MFYLGTIIKQGPDDGSVQVNIHGVTDNIEDPETLPYCPVMSLSNNNEGLQTIPPTGSIVLVGFIGNDFDFPFVLGVPSTRFSENYFKNNLTLIKQQDTIAQFQGSETDSEINLITKKSSMVLKANEQNQSFEVNLSESENLKLQDQSFEVKVQDSSINMSPDIITLSCPSHLDLNGASFAEFVSQINSNFESIQAAIQPSWTVTGAVQVSIPSGSGSITMAVARCPSPYTAKPVGTNLKSKIL